MRKLWASLFGFALILGVGLTGLTTANAQPEDGCYVSADSQQPTSGFDEADVISRVDVEDFDSATNETTVGATGTNLLEAMAFDSEGTLFGADDDRLGTIDTSTGFFTAAPQPFGEGDGSEGVKDLDDVDGLAFSSEGVLFGSTRRVGQENQLKDLLIQIDTATGRHIENAFGAGVDYLVIEPPAGLEDLTDIDDLAWLDSTLYGIANDDGEGDHLVTIDATTGASTAVGPTGEDDMEGLTTAVSGDHLWGITGDANVSAVWHIDPATGSASAPRVLDNHNDYEGISCFGSDDGDGEPHPSCTDDIDNDTLEGGESDGVDEDGSPENEEPDAECLDPEDGVEDGTGNCEDGLDNDGDGLTDADDPDCQDPEDPDPKEDTPQGGGEEEPCPNGPITAPLNDLTGGVLESVLCQIYEIFGI